MAITKIEQIYLYTDQQFIINTAEDGTVTYTTDQTTDSAKAIAWFAANGITNYVNLNYPDPTVHQDCFNPLNTWVFSNTTQTFADFPFAYYTEVHDDLPVNQMPMVLLYGLSAIENSTLAELYKLG